jgi:hypothetical protein
MLISTDNFQHLFSALMTEYFQCTNFRIWSQHFNCQRVFFAQKSADNFLFVVNKQLLLIITTTINGQLLALTATHLTDHINGSHFFKTNFPSSTNNVTLHLNLAIIAVGSKSVWDEKLKGRKSGNTQIQIPAAEVLLTKKVKILAAAGICCTSDGLVDKAA